MILVYPGSNNKIDFGCHAPLYLTMSIIVNGVGVHGVPVSTYGYLCTVGEITQIRQNTRNFKLFLMDVELGQFPGQILSI